MKENADLKGVVNSLRADSADLTDEVVNLTEISSGTNQSIKNLLSVFTRNATTTQVSSKKTEKKSAQAALKTERQTAEVSARAEQANEEGQGNLVGGFQTLSKEFEVGNKLRAAGGMISQKLLSNSTLMLFNSIRQYAGDLRERRVKLKEQRETEGRTTGFLENIALVGGMSIDRLDTLQSVFAKGAIERSEMKFQNKEIISINKERQKLASETKEAITGVLNEISDLKNQSENASGKTLDNLRKQIQLKQDEVRERRAAARLEQIRLKEAAQEAKKKAGLAGAKKPATPRQPTNLLSRILDPIVNLIKRNPLIGGGGLLAVGGIMMTALKGFGTKFMNVLKSSKAFFARSGAFLRGAGKLLGRLAGPVYLAIEAVIALFTGFKEAFQGEGNFLEKTIKGLFFSARNLVANVIGGTIDAIKSVFVFVAELFGGDSEDGWLKAVKDFSLKDMIMDFYDVIAEPFRFAKDLFSKGLLGASKAAKERLAQKAEDGNASAGLATKLIDKTESAGSVVGGVLGRAASFLGIKKPENKTGAEVDALSKKASSGVQINVQNNNGGNISNNVSTSQSTSIPAAAPIVTGSAMGSAY